MSKTSDQSTQPKSSSVQPKPQTNKPEEIKPTVVQPVKQVVEKKAAYAVERDAVPPNNDFDDMPPPPENFPDDWDTQWQPSFEEVAIASKPEPKFKKSEEITPPRPVDRDGASDAIR